MINIKKQISKIRNQHKFSIFFILVLAFILRFYQLGSNPPGLYWDEAVFGYDAYSILKTGHDHHGRFLPLFFESFGDWKLPLYHYLLVPSILIFDLNEFAVRFPSAFLGWATVFIFFLLVKMITNNYSIALISALVLAISPWHIQFSRGGFESTVGLFLVVLASYLFLKFIQKFKISILILSFILFVLSMYAYHAYRIFTPLLIITILLVFKNKIKKFSKSILFSFLVFLIISLPLVIFTFSPNGRARAISQSAFANSDYEIKRIEYDQKSKKPLRFLSKYWSRTLYFSSIAINNYLDHFSPVFLFFRGDQIGRHSQVDMGQIYLFEGITLIFSILLARQLKKPGILLMLVWLLVSPLPASIVTPTPHAYRTLQMSIPLAFFSGLGLYFLFTNNRFKYIKALLILIVGFSFLTYLHLLFVHYPRKFSTDWQDGYRQMVQELKKYQDKYDKVYVTNINQVPYIYLLFYQKFDPQKYINDNQGKDSFGKYVFISPEFDLTKLDRSLYVAPSWQKVDGQFIAAVDDINKKHIYSLWEIHGQN